MSPQAPAAPAPSMPAPSGTGGALAAAFLPVQAIFARSCINCHGPDKQKGHLRLDTPAGIRAGGKSGPAVVALSLEKSLLFQRVSLGADDPDVMPADGPHLAAADLAAIATWIRAGAPMEAGTSSPTAAAAGTTAAPTKPFDMKSAPDTALDRLAQGMAAPPAAALDALTQAGGWSRPVSKNGALLEIDARGIAAADFPAQLHAIEHLGAHVAWLNCAGTAISDQDCAGLVELPHLTRLHLERTAITDAALAQVARCPELTYLNLYATTVDDAGIAQLAPLHQLGQLFLRGTKATPAGAAALTAKIPGLQVVFDEDLPTGALPDGKKKKKAK